MAKHLTAEQITKYRERTLQPGELMAVDSHLGNCTECRTQLTESSSNRVTLPERDLISAIREAEFEHLTFDQMDAWVDDQMDQTERELVLSHIGLCESCARSLKAYEGYAHKMSAPVVRAPKAGAVTAEAAVFAPYVSPAAPPPMAPPRRDERQPTLGDKLRAFFARPQMAGAVLALAAVAIITPIVLNNRSGPGGSDDVSVSDLSGLPDEVRGGAEAVARASGAERPPALAGLAANSDPFLMYPVSEVVQDLQPEIRWKPFASSYFVKVYNAQNMLVARSDNITATHWLVSQTLERGTTYTFEVIGLGDSHRGQFRVLSDAGQREMAQLRGNRAGEHFVLGTVAQQYGMLSVAKSEFEALVRDHPQSVEAARLLQHVNTLIGR